MRLLLTSQGLPKELQTTFFSLLNKPRKDIKVAFIVTAAYGDDDNPAWLDFYRKQLQEYGINQIEDLDLKGKSQKELEKTLIDKDIIYVQGGNTFYLMNWVRKSGLGKLLPKLLKQGKLYIGISAGSIIACPSIITSSWKNQDRNKIGLKDLTGLSLVPFLIFPHFQEQYRPVIEKEIKNVQHPLIALNNTQAVLVVGGRWEVVGKGEKQFFNGFEENW